MKQIFLLWCVFTGICSIGATNNSFLCDDILRKNVDSLLTHSADSALYAQVRDTLIVWTKIEVDTFTHHASVSVQKSNCPALNEAVNKAFPQSIPPCFIATYGNEVFMNNGVIGVIYCFRPNRR